MKRRFVLAALTVLLTVNFAAIQALADNQKGTNCSQKPTVKKPGLRPQPASVIGRSLPDCVRLPRDVLSAMVYL